MTLQLLIDVNLSPEWVPILTEAGFEAVHWSQIGDSSASDREIMDSAVTEDYAVFSHDLDFSTMIALTHAGKPSLVLSACCDKGGKCRELAPRSILVRYTRKEPVMQRAPL